MLLSNYDINRRFRNHSPRTPDVAAALDKITETMIETGKTLADVLPECREASLAMTHLEQVSMFAKAAIARNQ